MSPYAEIAAILDATGRVRFTRQEKWGTIIEIHPDKGVYTVANRQWDGKDLPFEKRSLRDPWDKHVFTGREVLYDEFIGMGRAGYEDFRLLPQDRALWKDPQTALAELLETLGKDGYCAALVRPDGKTNDRLVFFGVQASPDRRSYAVALHAHDGKEWAGKWEEFKVDYAGLVERLKSLAEQGLAPIPFDKFKEYERNTPATRKAGRDSAAKGGDGKAQGDAKEEKDGQDKAAFKAGSHYIIVTELSPKEGFDYNVYDKDYRLFDTGMVIPEHEDDNLTINAAVHVVCNKLADVTGTGVAEPEPADLEELETAVAQRTAAQDAAMAKLFPAPGLEEDEDDGREAAKKAKARAKAKAQGAGRSLSM